MYTLSVALDGAPAEWRSVKTYASATALVADSLNWAHDPALSRSNKRITRDSDGERMELTPYGELREAQ